MIILPSNSSGEYEVANSLRFNDGSSDNLTRTPSSETNTTTWTFSCWTKRTTNGEYQTLISGNSSTSNNLGFFFNNTDELQFWNEISGTDNINIRTTAKYRDPSAWYHVVLALDTTQSTQSDRFKLYVNGTEQNLSISVNVSSNQVTWINDNVIHHIGGPWGQTGASYFDGYMAEVVLIDGQQLTPTSFGEFDEDTGIWKPINVSGLTFGTNGFYLDFENSSSLGADVSGNGNNFTVNNLTSIDQTTDTCTNNFATMNPLDKPGTGNLPGFAEGNLHYNKTATGSGNNSQANSTIAVNTGKWFFEIKALDSNAIIVGIDNADNPTYDSHGNSINSSDGGIAYYNNGQKIVYGTASSYGASWTTNDIIGIAINLDDNEITFYKNGSSQGAISITTTGINYRPAIMNNGYNSTSSAYMNFGNPPFSISSGNSDGNGYGNFEYAVPSGYYALNTKNLSEYG